MDNSTGVIPLMPHHAPVIDPMDPSVLRTRREMLGDGASDRDIRSLVRGGGVRRIAHGVYAGVDEESSNVEADYVRLIRATARRAGDPVLSHLSAAALLGLPVVNTVPDCVHVTGSRPTGGQRRGVMFRHNCRTPLATIVVDGLRCTTVARTLVDVGRSEDRGTALVVMDAALHRSLVVREELVDELAVCARLRGIGAARRAVSRADGRSESPGETLTRLLLHEIGFPAPELQVTATDAAGRFLGRIDLAYPSIGVLIEFDGLMKYGVDARSALIAEKRREDALRAAGFVVVRLTWRDLSRPEAVRRLVADAREQGRRAVAAGMITGVLRSAPWR